MSIKDIDNQLYRESHESLCGFDYTNFPTWDIIKNDNKVLEEAIEVCKDKFNEDDTLKGIMIANIMLKDYKSIDEGVYQKLINKIFSNPDIARTVIDGYSNGGFSFLLLALSNFDLKLTEEQKRFAEKEAMNKIGTRLSKEQSDLYEKELSKMGITDDETIVMDFDGIKSPVGKKAASIYMNSLFNRMSTTQAHGIGEFDIRYYILRNPNWSVDEKKALVYDFYASDDTYENCLEQWEWEILNDPNNSVGHITLDNMYDVSEEFVKYAFKEYGDYIWDEISFCRLMHELRPTSYEKEFMDDSDDMQLRLKF